jgi:hypothetical protein
MLAIALPCELGTTGFVKLLPANTDFALGCHGQTMERISLACPRKASASGGSFLLINLRLEGRGNFFHFLIAKLFFHPFNYNFGR